ncbi:MAG: exopolyphosphatase/guanosine-5'-triphosphate,3'-diphosphate pyrophosphatase [Bacteroidia bacterium]|jgi:exopolyphosphatase/guanosine-5'-triphosphate,3'-diphosphate pyrophosphatase
MKFGAIDIGSNAVRLLITNVFESETGPIFKKSSLVRVPIRLGEDVFMNGFIGEEKQRRMIQTMGAFKLLLDVHGVSSYRACATSAMRNATNSEELVEKISEQAGIDIEIIQGKKEADIIFSNHFEEHLFGDRSYLYIDVGGGSTELTIFSNNKPVASRSFRIGTIRLLNNMVEAEYWDKLLDWVEEHTKGMEKLDGIGSGGNINKLYKMAELTGGEPLRYKQLKELHVMLRDMSYEDRIVKLGLNADRADVIVPACEIFLAIMERAKIKDMIVPQFGLSDGITRLLYEDYTTLA